MPSSAHLAALLPLASVFGAGMGGVAAAQLFASYLAWPRRHAATAKTAATIGSMGSMGSGLTLIRPLSGLEAYSEATLRSTFELEHDDLEIFFCVAQRSDPIVALCEQLIAAYPLKRATLLIGNERLSSNPKLNNLIKGWQRTTTPWVMFADSNVLLPRDAVALLLAQWDERCGMVCTAPIGSRPEGWAAHLECAFLNGYQARWQIAANAIELGFAQGKIMFFQRRLLEDAGGLAALAGEPAEDAAATKVVRAAGLHVRLVDIPFKQPLGRRTLTHVWNRQVRWAQLRRATFPQFFYPEILSSGVVTTLLFACSVALLNGPVLLAAFAFATLWYVAELLVVARYQWTLSGWTLPLAILRDIIIPAVWLVAILKNDFEWQGHAMRIDPTASGNSATGG